MIRTFAARAFCLSQSTLTARFGFAKPPVAVAPVGTPALAGGALVPLDAPHAVATHAASPAAAAAAPRRLNVLFNMHTNSQLLSNLSNLICQGVLAYTPRVHAGKCRPISRVSLGRGAVTREGMGHAEPPDEAAAVPAAA